MRRRGLLGIMVLCAAVWGCKESPPPEKKEGEEQKLKKTHSKEFCKRLPRPGSLFCF